MPGDQGKRDHRTIATRQCFLFQDEEFFFADIIDHNAPEALHRLSLAATVLLRHADCQPCHLFKIPVVMAAPGDRLER
ncbi:hypothetical protein D3C83_60090 [compost metagenome]